MQGEAALTGFDIAKETGGRYRAVVKEFKGVKVKDKLLLRFAATKNGDSTAASAPVLCGIEVVREEK